MLDPPLSRRLPSTVQLFVLGVIAFLAIGATSPSSLLVAERSSVRHPVAVVGPLIGQTLQVNDARWLHPCSPWTPTWTTAWVNLDKFAAVCAFHSSHAQLGLTFDPTTNRTKSPEHVQVRVAEGWAGLTVFGYMRYQHSSAEWPLPTRPRASQALPSSRAPCATHLWPSR